MCFRESLRTLGSRATPEHPFGLCLPRMWDWWQIYQNTNGIYQLASKTKSCAGAALVALAEGGAKGFAEPPSILVYATPSAVEVYARKLQKAIIAFNQRARKFKPKAPQHELVWTGRVATTVMVLIGLAWVPVIRGADEGLYYYLQGVQGYLAPPIFVVFFFGVFMKRLNAKGCLAALIAGFAMGVFRLAVDTPLTLGLQGFENGYTENSFLWIVSNIYFQYYSLLIFLVSGAVAIGVSYATRAPEPAQIEGLTYATISHEDRRESRGSWGWGEVATSGLVMVAILAAYLYFTG